MAVPRSRRFIGGIVSSVLVLSGVSATTLVGAAPAFADDPVAGGQTASPADSLFPNQGNSGYDVSHYDINFKVDVTSRATANGAVGTSNLPNATTTIQATTTGAPLSSYAFDFQGSTGNLAAATLNVDSVTVNGVPATFSRIENTTTVERDHRQAQADRHAGDPGRAARSRPSSTTPGRPVRPHRHRQLAPRVGTTPWTVRRSSTSRSAR